MAKIKHTKNELKAQKEALRRYERFLPMLQLKKQQLQAEIQRIEGEVNERLAEAETIEAGLQQWVRLLSEPVGLEALVVLETAETSEGNIAGVRIPVLDKVRTRREAPDLFATPPWVDDAQDVLDKLIVLRVEREVLQEQKRLVTEELRTTSQRVNLFEKVKIPECKENIRVIKIFLGDEQTASVVRGKFAKKLTQAYEYKDEQA
jgi:V/A-type H+-transporting ATPase subunit D